MKRQRNRNKEKNIYRNIKRCGCVIASAIFFVALTACAPSNEERGIVTQTPTASPEVSAAPTATTTPTPTPIPVVTPEPTPAYTIVGQAYCDAKESVNIRAEANIKSEIVGAFPAGEAADIIEYSDDWAHLVYGGVEGYVNRTYILEIKNLEVTVSIGYWASIVVNPTNPLPEDFKAAVADFKGGQVDERILKVCGQMFADAKADGVDLKLVDAYRSFDTQSGQYEKKVKSLMASKGYSRSKAETEAAKITARPNTSEHQTGLALDIVTPTHKARDSAFAKTKAFKWLDENAYNYGFTLRYKKDKVDITKVIYEPWHWRFVGVKAAAQMKISEECLEEYFNVMD